MMLFDLLQYRERPALTDDQGRTLTYGELWQEGERLCAAVGTPDDSSASGIRIPRCLAFILCTNTIGAVLGHTAFLNHGIVPALLDHGLDVQMLTELIARYDPALIWAPEAADAAEWLSGGQAVYRAWGYVLYARQTTGPTALFEGLGLLLTTSGSTGSPRFVRQSYDNIRSNALAIASYLTITPDERPITTLPMHYTYGLSIIHSHLISGAQLLLTQAGIFEKVFWDFFGAMKATSLAGVPYTYEMLERLGLREMDLPSLATLTQAGGRLGPELHRRFAEWAQATGRRFFVMYGSCEATARMGYLPWERSLEKVGCIGIPIPGGQFILEETDGTVINTPETPGELIYCGPNVTLGYAEGPDDLALGDTWHGRLHTGDIAVFDDDGFYRIAGRKKRFLKVYGHRVSLDELEQLLAAAFPDTECVMTGQDDAVLLVLTNPEGAGEKLAWLTAKTGLPRKAFSYKIMETIPRNAAGKVQYGKLQ